MGQNDNMAWGTGSRGNRAEKLIKVKRWLQRLNRVETMCTWRFENWEKTGDLVHVEVGTGREQGRRRDGSYEPESNFRV